jgi:hypothetical protein
LASEKQPKAQFLQVSRLTSPKAQFLQVSRLTSIKTKIIVFALLATIIPSVSMGWFSYVQNRKFLNDKIKQELSRQAFAQGQCAQ